MNAVLTGKRDGASGGSEHKRRKPFEAPRSLQCRERAVRANPGVHKFVARRSIAIDCKFKRPARLQLAGAALDGVETRSGAVDLDHLSVRPLDRIGRRHALDRLRVHVDDDVLGLHLGGFLGG
jgi:hypothetical protein